jgi:hypothetical protein
VRSLACWDYRFDSRQEHGCLFCEFCVLSGRGLCDWLINRPEESYLVVCEYDREDLMMRRTWATMECCDMEKVC